jgi:predicted NBD/HSP70 family sugar kinase
MVAPSFARRHPGYRAIGASPAPVTGDQYLVKEMNRKALLRLLRSEPGLSRAELAGRSGLTRSTVSLLVRELLGEGWIHEEPLPVSSARGRRPTPLRLDTRQMVLLGAELAPDAIHVVATTLAGEVLDTRIAPLKTLDPDAACRRLVEVVAAQSSRIARSGARLLGIGVGLPGAVDKISGRLQFAPNVGWRDLEIGPRMSAQLAAVGLGGVPLYFHNEADLAAVGEVEFGLRPVDDPLVYVSCGIGVGAGIVLDGSLFTGATGSAGEIGHTTLVIDGARCACGRLGCAEAYIGLRPIAVAAGCLRGDAIDREALRDRLAAGDSAVRAAFAQAGRYLGVLMQNVWTTFNPMAIVVGGDTVTLGGRAFLDAAEQVLRDASSRVGFAAPLVRPARHAERAAAVGGAAYALHAILHPHPGAAHSPYVVEAELD